LWLTSAVIKFGKFCQRKIYKVEKLWYFNFSLEELTIKFLQNLTKYRTTAMAEEGYQPRGRGGMRGRGGPRGGGRGRGGGGFKRPAAQAFDGEGGFQQQKKRTALQNNHRFLIPSDLVQAIIGKGGSNIKEVLEAAKKADPEAKISIYAQCANGAPLMEGAADRVMGIQASKEGLIEALNLLLPKLQYPPPLNKKRKSEIRLMIPAHCGSAVIGKKGETVKLIKTSTDNSFVQVYTVPLPKSEEVVVRIQNFEDAKLIEAVCLVIDHALTIKEDKPIVFYDPIWFPQTEFGDTGSYIDTWWYQDAIKTGTISLTPYKGKGAGSYNRGGFQQGGYGQQGEYEQQGGYDQWGGNGYDYTQGGYEQEYGQQGGYDQSAYDPNGGYGAYGAGYGGGYGADGYSYEAAPAAPPARGGPRGGGPPRGRGRGRGAPQVARGGY